MSSQHCNLCIECGIDMGDSNPRQLCGKTNCCNTKYNEQSQYHQYTKSNNSWPPITKKGKQSEYTTVPSFKTPVSLVRQNAYSEKWNTKESKEIVAKLTGK